MVEVFAGAAEVSFKVDEVVQPFYFQRLPVHLWLAVAIKHRGTTVHLVNPEPVDGEVGFAVINERYKSAPLSLSADEIGNPPEWRVQDLGDGAPQAPLIRVYDPAQGAADSGEQQQQQEQQLMVVVPSGGESGSGSGRFERASGPVRESLASPVASPSGVGLLRSPTGASGTPRIGRSQSKLRVTAGLIPRAVMRSTSTHVVTAAGGRKKGLAAAGAPTRRHSREGPVRLQDINTAALARRPSTDSSADPFGYGRAKMIEGEEAVAPEEREAARRRAEAELEAERPLGTSSEEEKARTAAEEAAAKARRERRQFLKDMKRRGKTLDDTKVDTVSDRFPGL